MNTVEKSIVVNVPVSTAYNQWTQFEEFPEFMEGVEEVRQEGDTRLFWRANIGGKDVEWEAEIVEQEPDELISWRSTTGAFNAGTVRFEPAGTGATEVFLRLEYEPEGFFESVGTALGVVDSRVEGDLDRFKEFIEDRGGETGAWRGEVHGGARARGNS
ncbi:MAG: SRPBCC family protein [Pyrinomonadaceae bacterium]